MRKVSGIPEPISALLTFDGELVCAKETLGAAAKISVGEIRGIVELPSLKEWKGVGTDALDTTLSPPPRAASWKRGDKPLYWGRPLDYPSGRSIVEQALVTFPITQESEALASGDKIFDAIYGWKMRFDDYVSILTRRELYGSRVSKGVGTGVEFLRRGGNKTHDRINATQIIVDMTDASLKRKQFFKACRLSSTGKGPALEYRMALESYRAWSKRDFRKAVIEAATAAEIALTKRASAELSRLGVRFGDKLLDKFRMLGGRFELMRVLDVKMPVKDYGKLLLEPRNEVVHKAAFPTAEKARSVIETADELLALFSPEVMEG